MKCLKNFVWVNNMKIIDTHCHLNIEPYIDDLQQYLNLINTDLIMNIIGTTFLDSKIAIDLANKYPTMYASIGIHPNEVDNHTLNDIDQLEELYLNNKQKIIAIGETGFDFHYPNYDYDKQLLFLDKHFQLALKYDLTLILHIRDAHKEAIEYLKSKNKLPRIIIHCFSGSVGDMKEYIDLGCYISFSGIITFKNALDLIECVKYVPLNKMLSETDSPFLTPVPYRGKLNHPMYVQYINETIAKIKNMNINEISEILYNNATKCFNKKL